jgi:hypothetical protein
MPTITKITDTAQQGAAWALGVRLFAADGGKLDLTSGSLSCEVRPSARPSASPLATPTITIPDPSDNFAVLGLSAYKMYKLAGGGATFSATKAYPFEIDFAPASSPQNPIRVAEGTLNVSPGGNKDDLDPLAPDPTTATTVITLTVAAQSGLATALATTTTTIVISGATAPTGGQVLTAKEVGGVVNRAEWKDPTSVDQTARDAASSAQSTANAAIPSEQKGAPEGVATLGTDGIVPAEQLPNASIPTGTGWRHVTGGTEDGTSSTPTKSDIGLGNVNNTADTEKPVSTAQLTAIAGRVAKNDPITPATGATMVDVDAKGLVTRTRSATTADILESVNKHYLTDSEKNFSDRIPLALYTGVIDGCVLSINALDNTQLDISEGHVQYVDDSNPNSPIVETLSVAAITVTPLVGGQGLYTLFKVWVGIARTQPGVGTPQFSTGLFSAADRRRIAVLGTPWSSGVGSDVIVSVSNYPSPAWGAAKTLEDLFYALGGSLNVDGHFLSAHSGQLTLDLSSGHAVRLFGSASVSKDNPNTLVSSTASPVTSYRYWAVAGTSYGNALWSTLDPDYYDNAGTRTVVPEGKWTIQYAYWFPSTAPTPIVAIAYGQAYFNTLDEAKAAAGTQSVAFSDLATNGFFGGLLRARIYVQQGEADLSGAYIENMSQFVAGGAGSGGGFVTDHAMLAHLDFLSSGHTGFAPSNSPTFIGTITRTGLGTPAVLPGNALEIYDTIVAGSLQANLQNLDPQGSTDICTTADDGSDVTKFADLGTNGHLYGNPSYSSGGPDDSYLLVMGGDLGVIAGSSGKRVLFFTGGTTIDKLRATLTDAGFSVVGSLVASNLSGTNTGDQTLDGLGGVPITRTINGHPLSDDITVTAADIFPDCVTILA